MPFTKRGRWYWHKGRRYSLRQVKAYYATRGFQRKPRKKRR